MGPPRAQARGRRPPGHDPAALRARPGGRRCSTEARRRFGPAGFPVPVLLGVLPLQSARHAEFLHNEVPGITIPDAVRAAMAEAGDRGAEVGLELALELLTAVAPLVAGTYIMPSFGRYEQAPSWSAASGRHCRRRIAESRRDEPRRIGASSAARRRRARSSPRSPVAAPRRGRGAAVAAEPPGPPYPAAGHGQRVYDTAGVLSPSDIAERDGDASRRSRTGPAPRSSSTPRSSPRATARRPPRRMPTRSGPVGRRPEGLRRRPRDPLRHGLVARATARCSSYAGAGLRRRVPHQRERQAISTTTCCRCSSSATSTARSWWPSTRSMPRATPEHAADAPAARQVDADRRPRRRARCCSCCSSAGRLGTGCASAGTRSTSTTRRSSCRRRRPDLTAAPAPRSSGTAAPRATR